MSTFGMAWRLAVSLTVLGLIGWQSPVTIGICLFLAALAIQGTLFMRALRSLQRTARGRAFTLGLRRLAIELAAGVVVNAAVFFGSLWASAAYG